MNLPAEPAHHVARHGEAQPGPKVLGREERVEHFLINGREAMPDGGNLSIEAKPTPSTIEVTVADEGTGIPADVFEKMFDPFFTTKDLGTGLGLSMARDVMTRLGGHIHAENRSPRGAAFILNFPIPE